VKVKVFLTAILGVSYEEKHAHHSDRSSDTFLGQFYHFVAIVAKSMQRIKF